MVSKALFFNSLVKFKDESLQTESYIKYINLLGTKQF